MKINNNNGYNNTTASRGQKIIWAASNRKGPYDNFSDFEIFVPCDRICKSTLKNEFSYHLE